MGQTMTHIRWEWAQGRSVGLEYLLGVMTDTMRWSLSVLVVGPTAFREHWALQRQIRGCVGCARVHLPNEVYFTCGVCRDANHDLCAACHSLQPVTHDSNVGMRAENPEHEFHREVFPLCVSPVQVAIGATCTAQAMVNAFRVYGARDFLGTRHRRTLVNGMYKLQRQPAFEWLSYETAGQLAAALGTELIRMAGPGRFVGILGSMCVEWVLADIACVLKGCPVVLMHRATTASQLAHIMTETELSVLVVSRHLRSVVFAALAACGDVYRDQLPKVIWFDDDPEAHRSPASGGSNSDSDHPVWLHEQDFYDVVNCGRRAPMSEVAAVHNAHSSEVMKILPSSGSTGMPKLIVVTESALFRSVRAATQPSDGFSDPLPTIVYAYEVMRQAHDILVMGGKIGVFSGSFSRLFEDCRLLRPTVFGATPAFWNGLYRDFCTQVHSMEPVVSPPETDEEPSSRNVGAQSRSWKQCMVEWHLRSPLGNRLKALVSTGATMTPEVQKWLLRCFNCQVTNGYGTTETGGLCSNGVVSRSAEVRLIDRPDLGYLTSDVPFPRGEIVAVSSRNNGYFRKSAYNMRTKAMRTPSDGADDDPDWITIAGVRYFRTGDIGEQVGSGQLRVIDRAKSIFKLSQGVFISPETVESVCQQHRYVRQCFVWGNGEMSSVIAVVVPTSVFDEEVARSSDAERCDTMARVLRDQCSEAGLNPWEMPQRVHIAEEFSVQNGLLAASGMKLCRPALIRSFSGLFVEKPGARENADVLWKPSRRDIQGVCSGLSSLLHEVLDPAVATQIQQTPGVVPIASLGLDSLAIARLASKIQKRFHVTLTPRDIFACVTLQGVERAIFGGHMGLVGASACEETLAAVEVESIVSEAQSIIRKAVGSMSAATCSKLADDCVVLTGATGFLGSFLLDELLRFQPDRVLCLVRSDTEAHALQRLRESLATLDLDDAISSLDRVEVVVANLQDENLGLSNDQLTSIAGRVRAVFHCGAVVSSIHPLPALIQANVLGVARVYSMAVCAQKLSGRTVEFNHVSTLGFLPANHDSRLVPTVRLSDLTHKSGYAQSKFLAEHVLQACVQQCGLQARVFRPGVISGSTVTGAANKNDSVMLMIRGLIHEGAVCCTVGSPLPAAFNLCPVDTVAEIIIHSAEAGRGCENAIHICSPTVTRLSELCTWLQDAGYNLASIDPIAFCARVKAADESHPIFPFKTTLCTPRSPIAAEDTENVPTYAECIELHMASISPERRGITSSQLQRTLVYFSRCGLVSAPRAPFVSSTSVEFDDVPSTACE